MGPGELRAAEWTEFDLDADILGDTGRINENTPAALCPARVESRRDSNSARTSTRNRPREVRLPIRLNAYPLHERKHNQRALSPTPIPKGRNEGAWLSFVCVVYGEQVGPL